MNKVMKSIVTVPLLGVLCLSGPLSCAHRDAEALAQTSLVQLVEYRESLTKLSDTIVTQYNKTQNDLEYELTGTYRAFDSVDLTAAAAKLADETVAEGFSTTSFANYLTAVYDTRLAHRRAARDRVYQFQEQTGEMTKKLEIKKKELEAIQTKLEVLQTPRSRKEHVEDLQPIIKVIEAAISEVEEKDTN